MVDHRTIGRRNFNLFRLAEKIEDKSLTLNEL